MTSQNKNLNIEGLYWDLLEALQDGVERELRTYLQHFSTTEKEKKLIKSIREMISEIYDEYVEKGRAASN